MPKKCVLKGSLKRDFFLLSAVVIAIVLCLSSVTLYSNYNSVERDQDADLDAGLTQVRGIVDNNFSYVEDRLKSLSDSLLKIDTSNLKAVSDVLATSRVVDNTALGPVPYTNFDWVNPKGKMVVNTTLGILQEPRDMTFRDYIPKSLINPGKVLVDDIMIGIPSGKLLTPISIGLEDKSGKFIGTLSTGIDIERLNNLIKDSTQNSAMKYIILDSKYTDAAKNWVNKKSEPIAKLGFDLRNLHISPTDKDNISLKEPINVEDIIFSKIGYTSDNKYMVLVGYNKYYLIETLLKNTLPILSGILLIGLLISMFIGIVYKYIIHPIIALGQAAQDISLGNAPQFMPKSHIYEVFLLSKQLIKIRSYISRHTTAITSLNEKQREIAAQKESLEQLAEVIDESDKANARIIRDMRHITNDGLNVINLSAGLLASYFKGEAIKKLKNDEIISALETIQKEVIHIQTSTTDCLAFEMVDPVEILHDAITVKRKPIMKRRIVLRTNIPETMELIAVDRVRFTQIISGLIDRSISFLEDGHEITVSLRVRMVEGIKHLECSVEDDGFGFKEKFREDYIENDNFESLDGSNLSMKSIEKLIGLHGGTLSVKDSAGVGSIITTLIPYKKINATKSNKNTKKSEDTGSNVVSLFE